MSNAPGFVSVTAEVKSIGDDDEFPGRFEVIASTKALDRDGESMRPGALTLPDSAPFYVDHDWKDGALPIGRGVPQYEDDVMKAVGTYASTPRAQEIRSLVKEGIIDSCSVGFLNGKRETSKGIREVVSGDLFEISFTAIPINPEARVLAAKALGARPPARAGHKAVAGSYEQRSDELYEGLRAAYPDSDWVETVATFDDHVIVEVHGGTNGDKSFDIAYTFDGTDVAFGDATEVETSESLTITPVGSSQATTLSLPGSDAGDAPASAGASPADDSEQAKALSSARMRALGLPVG